MAALHIVFLLIPIVFGSLFILGAIGDDVIDFVRGGFVYFLDTELLSKKEKTENDMDMLLRHLSHRDYSFARKFVFRKNTDKVLLFLDDLNVSRLTYTATYCKALVKISEYDKSLHNQVEEIIIKQSERPYNHPELLLMFAKESFDLKLSKKKIFVAVAKTGNKNLINKFADTFKDDEEIEKLLSLM